MNVIDDGFSSSEMTLGTFAWSNYYRYMGAYKEAYILDHAFVYIRPAEWLGYKHDA